jgi:hypothetical protein
MRRIFHCPEGISEAQTWWCPWPDSNQHSLRNLILSESAQEIQRFLIVPVVGYPIESSEVIIPSLPGRWLQFPLP